MPKRWSTAGLAAFVASLIALPSLSIDIIMPGLASMRMETGASLLQSGLLITLFMMGLVFGQACLGPFSDYVGRRPTLLGGLALYAISGIGCASAQSTNTLLVFRAAQGFGAGAGTVLALAIVRDLLEGDAARVVRSYAVAAFNVVPIFAPSLGAMLLLMSGWRAAHAVPAAIGAVLFLWVVLRFGETRPTRSSDAVHVRVHRTMLLERRFVSHAVLNAASYAALLSYIAGSSLVFMDGIGLSARVYALVFAVSSIALMVGAWSNGCFIQRGISGPYLIFLGLLIGIASSLSLSLLYIHMDLLSGVLIALAVLSRGLVGPNAQQAALEPYPALAGTAAAVFSIAQAIAGTSATAVVVPLYKMFGSRGVAYAMLAYLLIATIGWIGSFKGPFASALRRAKGARSDVALPGCREPERSGPELELAP